MQKGLGVGRAGGSGRRQESQTGMMAACTRRVEEGFGQYTNVRPAECLLCARLF